ncbi:MAG: DUF6174 domain-containing protein [Treponema sp.]|jgi:hypothetical protein|nr:DUF6174 domain-containing protein [Treponema sp.]
MLRNKVGTFVIGSIILCVIFIIVYCFISIKPHNIKDVYSELEIEKTKWEELDIKNYSFKISNVRTGGSSMLFNSTITIKKGIIDNEKAVSYKYYYDSNKTQFWEPYLFEVLENFPQYSDIDRIYGELENGIKTYDGKIDLVNGHCKNIFIEYDSEYHIPKRIEFEYWYNPIIKVSDRRKYYAIDIKEFQKL